MTIVTKTKVAVKNVLKPKRPVFVEPEAENLEPSVYTPPPSPPPPLTTERPPIPQRFFSGGAPAEERDRWMKENGYG